MTTTSEPREIAVIPATVPRISVSPDGSHVAIVDGERVVVADVGTGDVRGQIEIPEGAQVGWLSANRVVVIAGLEARVVEVAPVPQRLDHTFEHPMRLAATTNNAALVTGEPGALVLTASANAIAIQPFPSRATPIAAGDGGASFLVGLATAIEEWDPQTRLPKRRLRLPRAATVTALGGSERTVWFTAADAPARLDAIALVARNQPKSHELPAPIVALVAHPRTELVACTTTEGRVYVVDLDGKQGVRTIADAGDAVGLAVGTHVALLVANLGKPVVVHPLVAPITSRAVDDRHLAEPEARPTPRARARVIARPRAEEVAQQAPPDPEPSQPAVIRTWRDELVAWTRRGGIVGMTLSAPIVELAERFEIPPELHVAIGLCYGAHLCGESGVPPYDIALVLRGKWDEALGRGLLASKGLIRLVESRIQLTPLVRAALDEAPPAHGALVGNPAAPTILSTCVVVGGTPAAIAAHIGCAVLVVHEGAPLADAIAEARAYGAVALTRRIDIGPSRDALVVMVDDEAAATALELPRLML